MKFFSRRGGKAADQGRSIETTNLRPLTRSTPTRGARHRVFSSSAAPDRKRKSVTGSDEKSLDGGTTVVTTAVADLEWGFGTDPGSLSTENQNQDQVGKDFQCIKSIEELRAAETESAALRAAPSGKAGANNTVSAEATNEAQQAEPSSAPSRPMQLNDGSPRATRGFGRLIPHMKSGESGGGIFLKKTTTHPAEAVNYDNVEDTAAMTPLSGAYPVTMPACTTSTTRGVKKLSFDISSHRKRDLYSGSQSKKTNLEKVVNTCGDAASATDAIDSCGTSTAAARTPPSGSSTARADASSRVIMQEPLTKASSLRLNSSTMMDADGESAAVEGDEGSIESKNTVAPGADAIAAAAIIAATTTTASITQPSCISDANVLSGNKSGAVLVDDNQDGLKDHEASATREVGTKLEQAACSLPSEDPQSEKTTISSVAARAALFGGSVVSERALCNNRTPRTPSDSGAKPKWTPKSAGEWIQNRRASTGTSLTPAMMVTSGGADSLNGKHPESIVFGKSVHKRSSPERSGKAKAVTFFEGSSGEEEEPHEKADTKGLLSSAEPTNSSGPSQLMVEATNKARMRRLQSNIVDAEYTLGSVNARKLTDGSINPRDAGGFPQVEGGDPNDSSPMSPRTAPAAQEARRYRSTFLGDAPIGPVACPGFGQGAAEDELRKALTLRKLKTAKLERDYSRTSHPKSADKQ